MPTPPNKTPPTLGRRLLLLLYSRRFTNYFLLFLVAAGVLGGLVLWPRLERRLNRPPPAAAPSAPARPALPFDSPEYRAQRAIADYLRQNEPLRLKSLAELRLNQRQLLQRIRQQESVGSTSELANSVVFALITFPPQQDEFLARLEMAARLLMRSESNGPLLEVIFRQGDNFPPADPAVWSFRLLHASHLYRQGAAQAALERLWAVENADSAPPAARAFAALQAGLWLEELGVPSEALERYGAAGAWFSPGNSAAVEALGRGAWLALELGDPDAAFHLFSLLRAMPAPAPGQAALSPVLQDLLDFTADPAAAQAYWARQQTWWPRWRELAPGLGGAELVARAGPQSHPNLPALAQTLAAAREIRSAERYFGALDLLLRAARWRPADADLAITMLYQGVTLAPPQADALFALADALAATLPPLPAREAAMLNLRVAALLDLDRDGEALAHAAAALAAGPDPPPPSLVVLHATASLRTGRERAAAIARLEAMLAAPGGDMSPPARAARAALLSDLHVSLGQEAAARRLLETELQTAQNNSAGADLVSRIQQQLARLQGRDVLALALQFSLPDWLGKFGPPWLAYAGEPAQAARLAGVDSPPAVAARQFAAALDSAGELAGRVRALEAALNTYPHLPLRGWDAGQAALDFARREDMPRPLRQYAFNNTLWRLTQSGQRAAAAQLLAAAPPDFLTEDMQKIYGLWIEYLAVPNLAAAQTEFAARIFDGRLLSAFDLVLAARVIECLARLGEYDAAEAAVAQLDAATLAADALPRYRELREHLRHYLANFRALQPAADALRRLVLDAAGPAADAPPPPRWAELNGGDRVDLDLLTAAEARAGLLAVIRDRLSYGDHPLQQFFDYTAALPRDPAGLALRWEIFAAVQALAARDPDRQRAAQFAMLVNFDDPALAARGWAALAPAADAAKFPQAAAFVQFYQKLFNWRAGRLAAAAEFPGGAPRGADAGQVRFALAFAVQRRDLAQIERILAAQSEGLLLSPPVLPYYLEALRLPGREAPPPRAAETARARLAAAVVESWWRPSREAAQPVFDLARALRDPAAYPRAWVDYQLAHVRNENSADLIRLQDAYLQGNWPEVLAAADAYLGRNPSFYDYYWPQAKALAELGRRREAVAPLRLFVRHAHNEPDHPAAAALLRELEAEFPASAAP